MPLSQYSETFHRLKKRSPHYTLRRGEVIATTETIHNLFYVSRGYTKRYFIKNDGTISVEGIYGPNDCFGIAAFADFLMNTRLDKSEIYYYESLSNVDIWAIPHKLLCRSLPLHQELYRDLFTIQIGHSFSSMRRLENQGIENSVKRVAHIICYYLERYGTHTDEGWHFKVALTQQDLADILDLARETVSIAISDIRKQHLLRGTGRTLVIPSLDKLKRFAYS